MLYLEYLRNGIKIPYDPDPKVARGSSHVSILGQQRQHYMWIRADIIFLSVSIGQDAREDLSLGTTATSVIVHPDVLVGQSLHKTPVIDLKISRPPHLRSP